MDSTFIKMIDASVQRLAADRENGFALLRQVPSTHAKLFVSYWDQADAGYWSEYLKSDFPSAFWNGKPPRNFEACAEQIPRQWEFLSFAARKMLGTMFTNRGKIPGYMRSPDVTDDMLIKAANEKWFSERDFKKAFGKHFEMELYNREGSSQWRISVKDGKNHCETRLIFSTKLPIVSYCHILNDSSPFLLLDHAGGTVFPKNWDMVSSDNLESAALLLKNIVNTFEASVA